MKRALWHALLIDNNICSDIEVEIGDIISAHK